MFNENAFQKYRLWLPNGITDSRKLIDDGCRVDRKGQPLAGFGVDYNPFTEEIRGFIGDQYESIHDANQHYGVYWIPNGCTNDASFESADYVFVEWDDIPFEEQFQKLDSLEEIFGEAAMVVKTAKSLHCYWRLSESMEDSALWVETQKRLIAFCGSDPSIHNVSRCMRVPGFDHLRWEDGKCIRTPVKLIRESISVVDYETLDSHLPVSYESATVEKSVLGDRLIDFIDAGYLGHWDPNARKGWGTCRCPNAHNHPSGGLSNNSLHVANVKDSSYYGAFDCKSGCEPKEVYRAAVALAKEAGHIFKEVVTQTDTFTAMSRVIDCYRTHADQIDREGTMEQIRVEQKVPPKAWREILSFLDEFIGVGSLDYVANLIDGALNTEADPRAVFPDALADHLSVLAVEFDSRAENFYPALLSVCSSLVADRITIKAMGNRVEPLVVNGVLIGETGEGKTPMNNSIIEGLQVLDDRAAQRHAEDMAQFETLPKDQRSDDDEPVQRVYYLTEATPQGMTALAEDQDGRGCLAFFDEAGKLLSPGKNDNTHEELQELVLKLFNRKATRQVTRSRKAKGAKDGRGLLKVYPVIGGCQPEHIHRGSDTKGLFARFLLSRIERFGGIRRVDDCDSISVPDTKAVLTILFEELDELEGGELEFSEQSLEMVQAYLNRLFTMKSIASSYKVLESYVQSLPKIDSYFIRLCGLIHLMENALDGCDVFCPLVPSTVEKAITLIEYFRSQALLCRLLESSDTAVYIEAAYAGEAGLNFAQIRRKCDKAITSVSLMDRTRYLAEIGLGWVTNTRDENILILRSNSETKPRDLKIRRILDYILSTEARYGEGCRLTKLMAYCEKYGISNEELRKLMETDSRYALIEGRFKRIDDEQTEETGSPDPEVSNQDSSGVVDGGTSDVPDQDPGVDSGNEDQDNIEGNDSEEDDDDLNSGNFWDDDEPDPSPDDEGGGASEEDDEDDNPEDGPWGVDPNEPDMWAGEDFPEADPNSEASFWADDDEDLTPAEDAPEYMGNFWDDEDDETPVEESEPAVAASVDEWEPSYKEDHFPWGDQRDQFIHPLEDNLVLTTKEVTRKNKRTGKSETVRVPFLDADMNGIDFNDESLRSPLGYDENWKPSWELPLYEEGVVRVCCDIETAPLPEFRDHSEAAFSSDKAYITAIGVSRRFNSESYTRTILNVTTCSPDILAEEAEVLAEFFEYLEDARDPLADYHVLAGHNFFNFDLPFIWNRARKHRKFLKKNLSRRAYNIFDGGFASSFSKRFTAGVRRGQAPEYTNFVVPGWQIVDTMLRCAEYDKIASVLSSLKLKVAPYELGLLEPGRVDLTGKQLELCAYGEQGFSMETLADYLEDDLEATEVLLENFLPTIYYQLNIFPLTIQQMGLASPAKKFQVELERYYGKELGWDLGALKKDDKVSFEGGLGYLTPGYYEKSTELDFSSLYPSLICHFRLGLGWKDPHNHFLAIMHYSRERLFSLKKMIKQAKADGDERMVEFYSQQRKVSKVVANGGYGFTTTDGYSFNNYAAGVLTTALGRQLIYTVGEEVKKRGFPVIFAATDAVLYHNNGKPCEGAKLCQEINALFPDSINLAVEFEDLPTYQPGEKNYMVFNPDGTIHTVKGYWRKRNVQKYKQNVIINYFQKRVTEGEEAAQRFIEGVYGDILMGKYPIEELIIKKRIGKAEKTLVELGIGEVGDQVQFFQVCKETKKPPTKKVQEQFYRETLKGQTIAEAAETVRRLTNSETLAVPETATGKLTMKAYKENSCGFLNALLESEVIPPIIKREPVPCSYNPDGENIPWADYYLNDVRAMMEEVESVCSGGVDSNFQEKTERYIFDVS